MTAKNPLKNVLIMAGGTGGHVFPGIAVASYLRDQGITVHWLGTQQGLEARVVPEAGIPIHYIKISGLRGKGLKSLLLAPFKVTAAIWQSLRVMRQCQPDVVIGLGGFVSGPGGIASWLLRKPLIIHEQNATAGFTNRLLAKVAKRVLEGFPTAFKPNEHVMVVGNPVRQEIANLPPPVERLQTQPFRLLVLGGSLGAQALNQVVPEALSLLPSADRPQVTHQTGDKHFQLAEAAYAQFGVQATLTPFIKDMAHAYAGADMVLCRAGALTVAELCTVGLGAIFIPFPHAVDDHQTANAHYMVQHQAAFCIQQAELTPAQLADIIKQLTQSPETRLKMAQAAYELRTSNVTQKIYQVLCDVVN